MRFRSQTRELTKEHGRPWPLCHCGPALRYPSEATEETQCYKALPIVIFKPFTGAKHSRLCAFPTVPSGQDNLNFSHPLFCTNILFPVKSYSFFLATSIQNYFKSSVAYFTEESKVYSGPDRQPESTMPMEKSTKQRGVRVGCPAVKIGEFSHLKGTDCYQTLDTK